MKAAGASKSMKVMKMKAVRAMPKSGIAAQVAENTGLKKSAVTQVLSSLADVGATEVKKAGSYVKFVLMRLPLILGAGSRNVQAEPYLVSECW